MKRWAITSAIACAVVAASAAGCKTGRPEVPRAVAPAATARPTHGAAVLPGTVGDQGAVWFVMIAPAGTDLPPLLERAIAETRAAGFTGGGGAPIATVKPLTIAEAWSRDFAPFVGNAVPASDYDAIDRGAGAILLRVDIDLGTAMARLAALGGIAKGLAERCGGWIFVSNGLLHTAASLGAYLPAASRAFDARTFVVVHQAGDPGELPELTTIGMAQLGLPELLVKDVPSTGGELTAALLTATAHTIAIHGGVTRAGVVDVDLAALGSAWRTHISGGTGTITWRARWWVDDGDEPQIELDVEGHTPGSAEALLAALTRFGGTTARRLALTDEDDAELAAAAARARAELGAMARDVGSRLGSGEALMVKTRFNAADGRAHEMWVDVASIAGTTFEGSLSNEPLFDVGVKLGGRVVVPLAAVVDYLLIRPDGSRTGGYSIEILERRAPKP